MSRDRHHHYYHRYHHPVAPVASVGELCGTNVGRLKEESMLAGGKVKSLRCAHGEYYKCYKAKKDSDIQDIIH